MPAGTADEEYKIDTYLRKKIENNRNNNVDNDFIRFKLSKVRNDVLQIGKLNSEIRMAEGSIAWDYGNVAILIGGDKSKVAVRTELNDTGIIEAAMDSPLAGNNFHSINLQTTENLIILGPRAILEKHKDKYGDRIVFIDQLSDAQKAQLNVPDRLQ